MRSAERSTRRKAMPFRSAMSMLCFYINRAGTNLSYTQKKNPRESQGRATQTLAYIINYN
jgi:hypothetical protein